MYVLTTTKAKDGSGFSCMMRQKLTPGGKVRNCIDIGIGIGIGIEININIGIGMSIGMGIRTE